MQIFCCFFFFLPAVTVIGMKKSRRRLILAVIIKTLVPILKTEKQRTFRGARDGERGRERGCPSVRPGGCEALVECSKAQRFLLRVLYETRPAMHTNTHLVECKRTMRFPFCFTSRRCCSHIKKKRRPTLMHLKL